MSSSIHIILQRQFSVKSHYTWNMLKVPVPPQINDIQMNAYFGISIMIYKSPVLSQPCTYLFNLGNDPESVIARAENPSWVKGHLQPIC